MRRVIERTFNLRHISTVVSSLELQYYSRFLLPSLCCDIINESSDFERKRGWSMQRTSNGKRMRKTTKIGMPAVKYRQRILTNRISQIRDQNEKVKKGNGTVCPKIFMYVAQCTLLLAWLARLARLGVVRGSSSSRTSLRRVGWR